MSNGNCCYDDKISIFICVTRTHTLTYENGDLTCYISYSLLPLPDREEERERGRSAETFSHHSTNPSDMCVSCTCIHFRI